MLDELFIIIIFAVPVVVLAWFITALVLFLRTHKENTEKRRTRRTMMIVPAVILGIILASMAVIVVLFAMAIKHM